MTSRYAALSREQLATLVLTVGMINLWNRLNIATRQVAGAGS